MRLRHRPLWVRIHNLDLSKQYCKAVSNWILTLTSTRAHQQHKHKWRWHWHWHIYTDTTNDLNLTLTLNWSCMDPDLKPNHDILIWITIWIVMSGWIAILLWIFIWSQGPRKDQVEAEDKSQHQYKSEVVAQAHARGRQGYSCLLGAAWPAE